MPDIEVLPSLYPSAVYSFRNRPTKSEDFSAGTILQKVLVLLINILFSDGTTKPLALNLIY